MEGRVIKSTGSWYAVEGEKGALFDCRLKGKLKLEGAKTTNPIAVGDRVTFEVEDVQKMTAIINGVLPRENYIIRKSVHNTRHGSIIASNIDQALLIVTLAFPATSLGFIDRFLVSAESFRIPVCLVFNKKDLMDEGYLKAYHQLSDIYQPLGYKTLLVSALDVNDIEAVKDLLKNKTTLFSGHSGVGKSTLINSIAPSIAQKTSEVSNFAQKGVHTTTFAEMFKIGENTYIIDTPGIKELGLLDIEDEELSHFFPEMRSLMGKCRFYNCTHTHEPGCAIEAAFAEGKIAESRYKSYLSMLDNEDNRR
ncbi:MAG: ribosome small subunit-dependent GTPase A [Bacteroidota bacterium]|nr:ribosome small subunit-dependent GTPase A [Bacteroidota bacterium]